MKKRNEDLTQKVEDLMIQNKELSDLNIKLQKTVIGKDVFYYVLVRTLLPNRVCVLY